jgi:hypothetical protein
MPQTVAKAIANQSGMIIGLMITDPADALAQ